MGRGVRRLSGAFRLACAAVLAVVLAVPCGPAAASAPSPVPPAPVLPTPTTGPAGPETRARKAVYVIPGICGSDLYAAVPLTARNLLARAPEFAGVVDPTVAIDAGESLWVPQSLHPLSALAMLACDKRGRPLMPVTFRSDPVTYGPIEIYEYMVLRLGEQLGDDYDVVYFAYDWRAGCYTNALLLQESIEGSGYEEVSLVAHSMGGLIASSYLAMSPANRQRIRRTVFIAVPFLGTPKALWAAETGNIFNMPMLREMTSPEARLAASNFRSIPELLPGRRAFDAADAAYVSADGRLLTDYPSTAAYLASLPDCGINTGFLPRAEAFQRSLYLGGGDVHVAAETDALFLCGIGRELVRTVKYDADRRLDGAEFGGTGDATVPAWSASLGVYPDGTASFGVDPERVLYKNVSHFGFTLDARTAALAADWIRGGTPDPADYGFSRDPAVAEAEKDAFLSRLADTVENGMFALYLQSIVDKLVVSVFD
ncbi:MAG: hypothetical protein KBA30_04910 [Clostridia bacterium]|nr:hypothetical protein [Clostridia bacterium]